MARKPTKSLKIEAVKDEDKEKALSAALATLEKNYGKGSIMRLDGAVSYTHLTCRRRG